MFHACPCFAFPNLTLKKFFSGVRRSGKRDLFLCILLEPLFRMQTVGFFGYRNLSNSRRFLYGVVFHLFLHCSCLMPFIISSQLINAFIADYFSMLALLYTKHCSYRCCKLMQFKPSGDSVACFACGKSFLPTTLEAHVRQTHRRECSPSPSGFLAHLSGLCILRSVC